MAEEVCSLEEKNTKPWFNGRENEINQMQQEITNWTERRNRTAQRRRARVGEIEKETWQAREELGEARNRLRGVQGSEQRGKYRSNVHRPEKAVKERSQGTGGTTITSQRFKAHFEKLTGERFENPREEIEIAVNDVTDIRKELLAMEANDLLNEEPDEEEIIREMKNVKESTLGKYQIRMIYIKESEDVMKNEVAKMVQFMFNNRAHRWEKSLTMGRLAPIFKKGDREVEGNYRGLVMFAMDSRSSLVF